jgi:hypothetical protein
MSITGSAIERTLLCAVMRLCFVILVASAMRLWAVITAISAIRWLMSATNSYPQLQKVIHSLWESPKITLNVVRCLTRSVRSTRWTRTGRPGSSRRALLSGALCIAFALPIPTHADSQASKDRFKLYLHSRVVKDSQYQCAYKLYMAESKFDSQANLGSHYGIPQLRNKKLKNLDGYTQIDWGIRYVAHRYKGNYCLAWKHFKDKGWH